MSASHALNCKTNKSVVTLSFDRLPVALGHPSPIVGGTALERHHCATTDGYHLSRRDSITVKEPSADGSAHDVFSKQCAQQSDAVAVLRRNLAVANKSCHLLRVMWQSHVLNLRDPLMTCDDSMRHIGLYEREGSEDVLLTLTTSAAFAQVKWCRHTQQESGNQGHT